MSIGNGTRSSSRGSPWEGFAKELSRTFFLLITMVETTRFPLLSALPSEAFQKSMGNSPKKICLFHCREHRCETKKPIKNS